MTRKQKQFSPVFIKAIDLLKEKNAGTKNCPAGDGASDGSCQSSTAGAASRQ